MATQKRAAFEHATLRCRARYSGNRSYAEGGAGRVQSQDASNHSGRRCFTIPSGFRPRRRPFFHSAAASNLPEVRSRGRCGQGQCLCRRHLPQRGQADPGLWRLSHGEHAGQRCFQCDPPGVAIDAAGNIYVADAGNNAVEQILAAGGYTTINTLGGIFVFNGPFGVAVDSAGNVFVADTGNSAVEEILAEGGYTTVKVIGSGFSYPTGVAVDAADNVYVADNANNAVKQVLAAGGYTTVNTLGSGFSAPFSVAVDGSGNVYVADSGNNAVKEILAAGGYVTVNPVGSGFAFPYGVTVDRVGNVYVADHGNNAVKEILTGAPVLVASVLPGSRSVELGNPATIFATMINSGATGAFR